MLRALQSLKAFLEGFDFIKMRPDKGFVVSGVPVRCLLPGDQRAGVVSMPSISTTARVVEVVPTG